MSSDTMLPESMIPKKLLKTNYKDGAAEFTVEFEQNDYSTDTEAGA
jgi:hypothetical protein